MKKENARESFVFYRSFYESIDKLSDDVKLEIYCALMRYALDGVEPGNLSPIANGFMILMRPQIDANTRRYNNGCKNQGKKGAKSVDENKKMPEVAPTPEPECEEPECEEPERQELPEFKEVEVAEVKSAVRVSEAQPMNGDVLTDDESARFQLLFPHTHHNRKFLYFIKWIKDNVPYCADASCWNHGITEAEFERLNERYHYSGDLIAKTVAEIANRRDLRDKYDNLYLTLLNWLQVARPLVG